MWPDWITFRPIQAWPGELARYRKPTPFKSGLSSTTELLARELDKLNASNVVLQVALQDGDIRLDGKPRANATPAHPGVILAFSMVPSSKLFRSRSQARAKLQEYAEMNGATDPDALYRAAVKKHHPDHGGLADDFVRLTEAHRMLTADDAYQFAIDTFNTWQDNLRAIALGLEALRKVERYGITKGTEQYTGWKQLTA